jgi:hypothetical protein
MGGKMMDERQMRVVNGRDGVEVDANEGIVKIIQRKEV